MKKIVKPFCSIIVLNYFGRKVLPATLNALVNLDYPKTKYEIVIVDNNSKDLSRRIIRDFAAKHKNIHPIFLRQNLGFSRGNNVGIKQAKGKYVVLLNNDCIVEKNWLTALVETAQKDKKIFAVNSKIILRQTKKIQNAGIMVFQDGYGRDIGAVVRYQSQDYEEDTGQYEKEKEIYAACGAAVLYRKSILEKIGYLDKEFFMYYEDVEIAERASFHGYKIFYCPKAIVYHFHAYSSKEWSLLFIYNAEKGRLLHLFYHFPISIFVSEYGKFFFQAFLRFFKEIFLIKKMAKNTQYFKICFYFLFRFPILAINRIKKHQHIEKNAINTNYQKILRGDWYLN